MKNNKGITLMTLTITIIILIIIAGMMTYYTTSGFRARDLNNMYSDIERIQGKIDEYYLTNNSLPIIDTENILSFDYNSNPNDNLSEFYLIDLSVLGNLKLNYGRDFESLKNAEFIGADIDSYPDVYIINTQSQNIYYYKGIEFEKKTYFTKPINYTKVNGVPSIINVNRNLDLETAISEAKENVQINIGLDINFTEKYSGSNIGHKLEFPQNTVLDLKNHTISSVNYGVLYRGNDLTIKNGKFETASNQSYALFIWDNENSFRNVLLDNIEAEGGINTYNAYNITLRDVTVNAHKYYAVYGNLNTSITIESGTYTASSQSPALFGYAEGQTIKNPSDGFAIKGGTFITNGKPFCLTSKHIPPVIYGGTFDCDVTPYLAEGYVITKKNEWWVVEKEQKFLTVNDETTIEDAVSNAGNGYSITLEKDIDYTEKYTKKNSTTAGYIMNFNDNNTLDLGTNCISTTNFGLAYQGNNLTIKNGKFNTAANQSYALFLWDDDHPSNNVKVEDITTEGGICMYNAFNVTLKNVTANAHRYYAVYGNVNTSITIEGGTYTASSQSPALFGYAEIDDIDGVQVNNPADGFKIYGGTFITNGRPFCLTSNHIPPIIYGGTFDCDISEYVDSSHTVHKQGDRWIVN